MSEIAAEQIEHRYGNDRKRTLKKAVIAFNDRFSTMECIVRNQSEGGAYLEVTENYIIPSIIELRIHPQRDFRPAEVMWRGDEAIGIRFLDSEKSAAPEKPPESELFSDSEDETDSERRGSSRKRALRKAVIVFNDRFSSMNCLVRNESQAGARLEVSETHVVPNIIEIKVAPSRDFRTAEVIWRQDNAVGIRFING